MASRWIEEELTLVFDLYLKDDFAGNSVRHSPRYTQLADILNRLPSRKPMSIRKEDEIYWKLYDFRRFETDPARLRERKGAGSLLDQVVWDKFAHNPHKLRDAVGAILSKISGPTLTDVNVQHLGVSYRRANETPKYLQADPFPVDPGEVERGLRGHALTQNALADHLLACGLEPLSPKPDEPQFDLAWIAGDRLFITEIKSITPNNEECQLRLGIGQVLHYREKLQSAMLTTAVLVPELPPRDPVWGHLCKRLEVILCWPGEFDRCVTAP